MQNDIVLCGSGDDGAFAAMWAEDQARAARLSDRAVAIYAETVRAGYERACATACTACARPVMRISLKDGVLTPRFEMVGDCAEAETAKRTPRAARLLDRLSGIAGAPQSLYAAA